MEIESRIALAWSTRTESHSARIERSLHRRTPSEAGAGRVTGRYSTGEISASQVLQSAVFLAFASGIAFVCPGCCDHAGRDWTVTGQILDAETEQPVVGAQVQLMFLFTIDGPGNRQADGPVATDDAGRFVSTLQFVASCDLVLFGYFGTEANNTAGAPMWLEVTVVVDGIETTYLLDMDDEQVGLAFESTESGIEGSIELPRITLPA